MSGIREKEITADGLHGPLSGLSNLWQHWGCAISQIACGLFPALPNECLATRQSKTLIMHI